MSTIIGTSLFSHYIIVTWLFMSVTWLSPDIFILWSTHNAYISINDSLILYNFMSHVFSPTLVSKCSRYNKSSTSHWRETMNRGSVIYIQRGCGWRRKEEIKYETWNNVKILTCYIPLSECSWVSLLLLLLIWKE